MGSEDPQEEVVTAAEGSAGCPPAAETSGAARRRRREPSRRRRRGSRALAAQRTARGAGRGCCSRGNRARAPALGRPTRPGGGPSARPGPRARRQQPPASPSQWPGTSAEVTTPASAPGSGYAIRVEGLLDAHWSQWLEEMTITHEGGGVTRIEGPLIDQAALHGLLNKLRDLRLPIVTVQRLGALDSDAPIQRTTGKQC